MTDKYNYIRTDICNIISRMLDNPNEYGIYPTTLCYGELESYIRGIMAGIKE